MNVLLCCGAGVSSGFLASSARKVAKGAGIDIKVEARSHADVAAYLSKIDILMLGPHYRTEFESFRKMAEPYGVPVALIPEDIYATMDGGRLIELANKTVEHARQEC